MSSADDEAGGALAFPLEASGGRNAGLVDIRHTARRANVASQAIAVRQLVEELLANDSDERESPCCRCACGRARCWLVLDELRSVRATQAFRSALRSLGLGVWGLGDALSLGEVLNGGADACVCVCAVETSRVQEDELRLQVERCEPKHSKHTPNNLKAPNPRPQATPDPWG